MERLFDEFSKSLAGAVPRRESLRLLGAALASAVVSPLGLGTAWGAKPDPCKSFCRCSNKKQQNQCLAACGACNKDPRRLCGSCGSYVCCASETRCCGNHCVDLASDFDNCGGCGNACDDPAPYEEGACVWGACVYLCVEGAIDCDGMCTPVNSDPDNCGACGNVCPASAPYCDQGACTNLSCPGGQTLCSGTCYDLYNDSNNCGTSCEDRKVCGLYENCTGGMCVPND